MGYEASRDETLAAKGLLVNKLIFLRLVSTPISVSRILAIAHYDCESAP